MSKYKPLDWYSKRLLKNPLSTKCLTSFIIYGIGDLICQNLENKQTSQFNTKRFLTQATYGFISAPLTHFKYNIFFPRVFPPGSSYHVLKSIAFTQVFFAPVFYTNFILWNGLCNGSTADETLASIKAKLLPFLLANVKFWPFIQVVTLCVVPIEFRVLWTNVCSCVWAIVMSYIQSN